MVKMNFVVDDLKFVLWHVVFFWRQGIKMWHSGISLPLPLPDHVDRSNHPFAGRNSRSESGRSSRRSRRGEDTTPAKLSVPNHFFFSRDESRNCFNFHLKPTVDAHKRVICDGCIYTLNKAGGILTPDFINRTRGTNVKKKFQRPWDQKWKRVVEKSRHNDFMALFEDETTIITPCLASCRYAVIKRFAGKEEKEKQSYK